MYHSWLPFSKSMFLSLFTCFLLIWQVIITQGAHPTIHGNQIFDGEGTGMLLTQSCKGKVIGNTLYGNAGSQIEVSDFSDPLVCAQDPLAVMLL